MKIKDIVNEEVDMGFLADIDADYNPHHLKYIQKQERRQDILNKNSKGTAIFKKPVRQDQKPFTTTPPKDEPQSAGYIGLVDASIRAGHITNDEGKRLTESDD